MSSSVVLRGTFGHSGHAMKGYRIMHEQGIVGRIRVSSVVNRISHRHLFCSEFKQCKYMELISEEKYFQPCATVHAAEKLFISNSTFSFRSFHNVDNFKLMISCQCGNFSPHESIFCVCIMV